MAVAGIHGKSLLVGELVLLIISSTAFNERATITVHYIIPSEWTDSNRCSNCYTLNDLIDNKYPFTNDTIVTVVLSHGLHLINSTVHEFLIENISSLILTGQGEVTVECLCTFTFVFRNIKNMTVSHIKFKHCGSIRTLTVLQPNIISIPYFSLSKVEVNSTLLVLCCQHITIQDLNITHGGLIASVCSEWTSILKFRKLNTINGQLGIYGTSPIYTKTVSDIFISDSIFKSSNMYIDVPKGLLHVRMVLLEKLASSAPALHIDRLFNVTLTNITFQNNSSPLVKISVINSINFKGNCAFYSNKGESGIYVRTKRLTLSSDTKLKMILNEVKEFLLHIILYDISGNRTASNWLKSVIQVQNNTFKNGVIVEMVSNSITIEHSCVIFENNNASKAKTTTIMLLIDAMFDVSDCKFQFINNIATRSGGITFMNSYLHIHSTFSADFINNQGGDGAAMSFYKKSSIKSLTSYGKILLNFHHNRALNRGGAIFVEDSDYINSLTQEIENYFMHPRFVTNKSMTQFVFSNNSAVLAGNDMYGGWIDLCKYTEGPIKFLFTVSMMWVFSINDLLAVTSNPIRVCMCHNSTPLCNVTEYKVENKIFPGQTFEIEAVAVGQRMGIVPSVVIAQFSDEEGSLGEGENVQYVVRQCTKLQFTVFSLKHYKVLELRTQGIGVPQLKSIVKSYLNDYQYLFQQFSISISMANCNFGFVFRENLKKCECSPLILHHQGVECIFSTWSIKRKEGKWLDTTNEHSNITPYKGIIIHDHCPYDYCRTDADSLTFHLETPDDQCAFNHSGVLCGACQANLSQVFGTSKCRECSNIMLLAVIPATILLGIVLVALLMILNLTISTGTINGLIFYANIIRASQAVFFPPEISSSFLSIFIAWLNLDLGIEACFYDGLDAYAKTWLQFVFPLYIWLMVITIIVASHYSFTASKLFGNNAVQVLATLLLLSYAKILRVVITVFSFTVLLYPDGYEKKVWLLDGNIEFLCGKHIPLFIASLLMFILLSVPYTFLLVSIQWLQRISHYRMLFWVHRLMPLLDAYTGPYKHKHRYWTGLLLLARVHFILVFSLNITNNPAVNLLAIAVISFTLLTYLCYIRVYKNQLHNILEALSLFNLGLLSVATLYQMLNEENKVITTYLSTSVAFFIFLCILAYQTVQKFLLLKKIMNFVSTLFSKSGKLIKAKEGTEQITSEQNLKNESKITHSSVELTQLLI